jgi:hypothetical protein
LPWIGYFDKIDQSDIFCFLDNVQFKKNEWQNRNRIKTHQGWQWLTVPVIQRFPQNINEVRINNRVNWRRKHLAALKIHYGKAPYFNNYIDLFETAYAKNWDHLAQLNIYLVQQICKILDIGRKPMVLASHLSPGSDPTGRLIDIVQSLKGDTYLAGRGGANYMRRSEFDNRNIEVVFQHFVPPAYPQCYGRFQPNLSIIDLLFNCGPESIRLIRCNRRQKTLSEVR